MCPKHLRPRWLAQKCEVDTVIHIGAYRRLLIKIPPLGINQGPYSVVPSLHRDSCNSYIHAQKFYKYSLQRNPRRLTHAHFVLHGASKCGVCVAFLKRTRREPRAVVSAAVRAAVIAPLAGALQDKSCNRNVTCWCCKPKGFSPLLVNTKKDPRHGHCDFCSDSNDQGHFTCFPCMYRTL